MLISNKVKAQLLKGHENYFSFNANLDEWKKNGIVDFSSEKNKYSSIKNWNGKSLTIPVYGVYEISFGFSTEVIEWFFNTDEVQLLLLKNENEVIDEVSINEDTKCYYGKKSSEKSILLSLNENETLCLKASITDKENQNIKAVFFRAIKIDFDDESNLE